MRSGRNPARRNRNIGTKKSGLGQDNRLVIPWQGDYHWRKLGAHRIVKREIARREMIFVVEHTSGKSIHPCTVDDVVRVLLRVSPLDLEDVGAIIMRQPTRKQRTLEPVWGRFVYFVELDGYEGRAIILEAVDVAAPLRWGSKSLDPERARELERLREDGHPIEVTKRGYVVHLTLETARATVLYRTLLHELGHSVDYLEKVERPSKDQPHEVWSALADTFRARPQVEREHFANAYATREAERLRRLGVIPFERCVDKEGMQRDGLRLRDFVPRD